MVSGYKGLVQMEEAATLYQDGDSIFKAAKKKGVSPSGLNKFLHRWKIPIRGPGPAKIRHMTDEEKAEIIRLYDKEFWSLEKIAYAYGMNHRTVSKLIKSVGHMTRNRKEGRHAGLLYRDEEMANKIMRCYSQGMPLQEIRQKLHTSLRRVRRVVEKNDKDSR